MIVIQARGFTVLRHRDYDIFFKGGGNKTSRRVPQVPFYSRRGSFSYVIGFHLPKSSALGFFIHASDTGHAEGVPVAPSRGRSVEFPSKGNRLIMIFSFSELYLSILFL